LFVSLMYVHVTDLIDCWVSLVGVDSSRFPCGLIRKFGKIVVFRVWEFMGNGYPYFHKLIYFAETCSIVFSSG
jgi:hypothetical protein